MRVAARRNGRCVCYARAIRKVAERVHFFQIGGGIAAGAALLGAGIAAYKHHEKKEDKEEEVSVHRPFAL